MSHSLGRPKSCENRATQYTHYYFMKFIPTRSIGPRKEVPKICTVSSMPGCKLGGSRWRREWCTHGVGLKTSKKHLLKTGASTGHLSALAEVSSTAKVRIAACIRSKEVDFQTSEVDFRARTTPRKGPDQGLTRYRGVLMHCQRDFKERNHSK